MNEIKDLASIIKSIISDLKIEPEMEKYRIFNHWEEIVGKEISNNAKPQKIIDDTLIILAASPIWANELNLMSEGIIEKINGFVKKDIIKKIRVKAGR